jgi:hypothetical protein
MSKRFISPNWKALRKLPGHLQRVWFYIWDKADESGVYHFDYDYMKIDLVLDAEIHLEDLKKLPECKILEGGQILIKDFLIVNNGGVLKPGYNPHKPIFRAIEKNGIENFKDLGLIIETGTKEDKKRIVFTEYFNIKTKSKLENKNASLEEEEEGIDEGEGVGEDKGGTGGKEIIPQMQAVWVKANPHYPTDRVKDTPALLSIAKFICEKENIRFNPTKQEVKEKVLSLWTHLSEHIPKDNFFKNYSLSQVDKHLQAIVLSIQNGSGNNTNGKQNSKLTAHDLNKAHLKHFG